MGRGCANLQVLISMNCYCKFEDSSKVVIFHLTKTFILISYRTLDPVVLPTEASQAVKLRVLNFTRSLSTVLAFAQCLSRFALPLVFLYEKVNVFTINGGDVT